MWYCKSPDESKCKKEQQSHLQTKKVLWLGTSGPINFRSSKISLPIYVITRSPLGFENSHLLSIFLHNSKLLEDWNKCKKRPDSKETKWDAKESIQRETNRGPPVPRAQEWPSPYKGKIQLTITDPSALALGQAPAVLISEVQDWGGESLTTSQGPPAQTASGACPFTLRQLRRHVLTLSSPRRNSPPASIQPLPLPSRCSLKEADVLFSVY